MPDDELDRILRELGDLGLQSDEQGAEQRVLARLEGEIPGLDGEIPATTESPTVPSSSRRPRRRGWRRTSLFALAGALGVSGGAIAATTLVSGPSAETEGRKIALQAVRETASQPPCTMAPASARPVLSTAAPLSAITAALPSLAVPASAVNQARALAMLPAGGRAGGGAVLRRTARVVEAHGSVTLLVYVQQGPGLRALSDPDACREIRRERAALLADDRSADVQRWVTRRLAQLRDTAAGLQTLWIVARVAGQASSGDSGMPIVPGQTLGPGILGSSSAGDRRRVYVGIAARRATRVVVRAAPDDPPPGMPNVVVVRQGLYAVVLPAGTGRVLLRELSATGAEVHRTMLRG